MNPQDIDLEKLLKRLHLPTMSRLYAGLAARAAQEGWSCLLYTSPSPRD